MEPGLIAGLLSIVSYGCAMLAFRYGATPRLAALRETSILFGVAIGVVFLKSGSPAGGARNRVHCGRHDTAGLTGARFGGAPSRLEPALIVCRVPIRVTAGARHYIRPAPRRKLQKSSCRRGSVC